MKIYTLCLPFWVPSFRCDSSLKLHAKFSKTDSLCFTWKAWLTNCFIILCAVFVRFTKYIILCTLSIKYYFLSHWEILWNNFIENSIQMGVLYPSIVCLFSAKKSMISGNSSEAWHMLHTKLSILLIFCCHCPTWLGPVLSLLQYSDYAMVDSSSVFTFVWWVSFSGIVFWQNATGCIFTLPVETTRSNSPLLYIQINSYHR